MYRALARPLCARVRLSLPRQSLAQCVPAVQLMPLRSFATKPPPPLPGQSANPKPMGRPRRDEEITARYITFVDEKGEVVEQRARLSDVLQKVDRTLFFLMEVQPGKVPVCRLFDKKAMFEKQKQKKKSKQGNPEAVVKEIVFGWNVSAHDMEHKLGRAKQFLEKGNKVKIEIVTKKGQQRLDKDEKVEVIDRVAEHLGEYKISKKPSMAGGNCIMQYERK